jgi:hypothetical protein
MQVLRRAAVLVLLGLSLGISGAYATTARSEVWLETVPSATNQVESWWNLVKSALTKAGCVIDPWGQCGVNSSAQSPSTKEGAGTDPLGRSLVNSAMQSPNTADAGCTIDPLGRCLGH